VADSSSVAGNVGSLTMRAWAPTARIPTKHRECAKLWNIGSGHSSRSRAVNPSSGS
jgi:hypothetical protein